jgi:O-antigen/teichoic acid export membrane protein
MKISSHLGKISWSLADKLLYVAYGLVQFAQIKAMPTEVNGLFALLVGLNTWIMIVSDGSALAGIIQFGVNEQERRRVNTMALLIHTIIVAVPALMVFAFQGFISVALKQPDFAQVASALPLYCLLTFPRMYCLKLIYRDMRMRDLFVIDAVWFGIRTGLTLYALNTNGITTLHDIIVIDFCGMAASSFAAILYTRKQMQFGLRGEISVGTYLRYGLPLAGATALNSTPRLLDVYVVTYFFGSATTGIYNSAKTLYRLYEQAFDAVVALLYPAAVRLWAQQRIDDLQVLITKALSITIVPIVVLVLCLQLGASSLIGVMLSEKYAESITHFNVLSIAALAMPFVMMSTIIAAMGRSVVIVRYSAVGVVAGFAVLLLVGSFGYEQWVGLGLVVNTIVVGVLCTLHVRRTIPIPLSSLARIVVDVKNQLKGKR